MRALSTFVCAIALVACHKGGAARLEGHWTGQKATGLSAETQTAGTMFASEMTLDFHADTIVVKTEHEKQTGHYRVVREDKDTVVIVTDDDGPNDEQTFTFEDGGKTLKWAVLKDKAIVFAKQ